MSIYETDSVLKPDQVSYRWLIFQIVGKKLRNCTWFIHKFETEVIRTFNSGIDNTKAGLSTSVKKKTLKRLFGLHLQPIYGFWIYSRYFQIATRENWRTWVALRQRQRWNWSPSWRSPEISMHIYSYLHCFQFLNIYKHINFLHIYLRISNP